MNKSDLNNDVVYVEAYRGFIIPEKPLLISLHRKDGTLLAQKQKKLTEEQAVGILKHGSIYTPRADLVKALARIESIKSEGQNILTHKVLNPFNRTFLLIDTLEKILLERNEETLLAILALSNQIKTACNSDYNQVFANCLTKNRDHLFSRFILSASILYMMTKQMDWKETEIDSLMCAALTLDLPKHTANHKNQENLLQELKVVDHKWYSYIFSSSPNDDSTQIFKNETTWGSSMLIMINNYVSGVLNADQDDSPPPSFFLKKAIKSEQSPFHVINRKNFLKVIGIYPSGSMVKMKDNKIGLIVKQGSEPDHPFVKLLFDSNYKRIQQPVLQHVGTPPYLIKETIQNRNSYSLIDFKKLWK